MSKEESRILFFEIPINSYYGPVKNRIYYLTENNRSYVMEKFRGIDNRDTQDNIKVLISKMATVENFRSHQINHHLKGYGYGEICPKPHRFFFFQLGSNIVFFDYTEKKKKSFNDTFYRTLNNEREKYEGEFREFIARGRRNL